MQNKRFICYICNNNNNFFLPNNIKGKCCQYCNTFNYFNFKRKKKSNEVFNCSYSLFINELKNI